MAILRTRQAFGRRRDRDTARDNNVSGTTACAKSLAKLCRLLRRVRAILHTLVWGFCCQAVFLTALLFSSHFFPSLLKVSFFVRSKAVSPSRPAGST